MGPPPCHEKLNIMSIRTLLSRSNLLIMSQAEDDEAEVVVVDPDGTDQRNNNNAVGENEVSSDGTRKTVIGEPDSTDFRLKGSVVYTHNYFRRVDRNNATCLTCKEFNESNPNKVQRKENYKINGGNTSGKNQLI